MPSSAEAARLPRDGGVLRARSARVAAAPAEARGAKLAPTRTARPLKRPAPAPAEAERRPRPRGTVLAEAVVCEEISGSDDEPVDEGPAAAVEEEPMLLSDDDDNDARTPAESALDEEETLLVEGPLLALDEEEEKALALAPLPLLPDAGSAAPSASQCPRTPPKTPPRTPRGSAADDRPSASAGQAYQRLKVSKVPTAASPCKHDLLDGGRPLLEGLEIVATNGGPLEEYSVLLAQVPRRHPQLPARFFATLLKLMMARLPPPEEMVRQTLNLALPQSAPVLPALSPSVQSVRGWALDGWWRCRESAQEQPLELIRIEGNIVTWQEEQGAKGHVTVDWEEVVLKIEGEDGLNRGKLQGDGKLLRWDDGEVWERTAPTAAAAGLCSEQQLEALRGRVAVEHVGATAASYFGHFATLLHLEALEELKELCGRLRRPAWQLVQQGWALESLEVADVSLQARKKSKGGKKCQVVFATNARSADVSKLRLSPGESVLLSIDGPLQDCRGEGIVAEMGWQDRKYQITVTFDAGAPLGQALEATRCGWRLDCGPNRTAHERQLQALLQLVTSDKRIRLWDLLLMVDVGHSDTEPEEEPAAGVAEEEDAEGDAPEEPAAEPRALSTVLEWCGRDFNGTPDDYHDLACNASGLSLGGAFSVAFTARWASLANWSRIIDFGSGEGASNIFIGNRGTSSTFVFNVWEKKREYSLQVKDLIRVGETHRYLCTVTSDGFMRVLQDGVVKGEIRGAPPPRQERTNLYVGRSAWARDSPFHGRIEDLQVWDAVVNWDTTEVKRVPLKPAMFYDGREYKGDECDWDDLGSRFGHIALGGNGLSIGFAARWHSLLSWSRIIDFGNGPGGENIVVGNVRCSTTLVFNVWDGRQEHGLQVPDAIEVGKLQRFLCTVDVLGHMRVFRDGELIAKGDSKRRRQDSGGVPCRATRRFLYVAKSHWNRDEPFHGEVQDLRVWNAVVDWEGRAEDAQALQACPRDRLRLAAGEEPSLDSEAHGVLEGIRATLQDDSLCHADLNPSQREAVSAGLTRQLTLVQGPPGTGKTHVSVSLLRHWAVDLRLKPLLATSDSNIAVDNIAEGAVAAGLEVVRVGRLQKVTPQLEDVTLDARARKLRVEGALAELGAEADPASDGEGAGGAAEASPEQRGRRQGGWGRAQDHAARQSVLKKADVVCTTTVAAGSDLFYSLRFQAILIDEAAQATESSAAVPIALRGAPRLVLVGDHCQLPPSVSSQEAKARGLSLSLFQRLVDEGVEPFFLDTQFRMHSEIAAFSAKQFYDGKLTTGVSDFERRPPLGFDWPQHCAGVAFVNVCGSEAKDAESKTNSEEVRKVEEVLAGILEAKELGVLDVGVVSPYAAQVRLLRERLRSAEWRRRLEHAGVDPTGGLTGRRAQSALEIASVDAFQGREKELIVFSAVRSNSRGNVGFLADWRRLNVMLTRAKRGLIVIGNAATLQKDATWNSWLVWAHENGFWWRTT